MPLVAAAARVVRAEDSYGAVAYGVLVVIVLEAVDQSSGSTGTE